MTWFPYVFVSLFFQALKDSTFVNICQGQGDLLGRGQEGDNTSPFPVFHALPEPYFGATLSDESGKLPFLYLSEAWVGTKAMTLPPGRGQRQPPSSTPTPPPPIHLPRSAPHLFLGL